MNRHERRARAAKQFRGRGGVIKKGDVWWKQYPSPESPDHFILSFRIPNLGMPDYEYAGDEAADRAKRWSLAFAEGAGLNVERAVEEYKREHKNEDAAMQETGAGAAPVLWVQREDPDDRAYVVIAMLVPAAGMTAFEIVDTNDAARCMALWAVAFLARSGVDVGAELDERHRLAKKVYGRGEPS